MSEPETFKLYPDGSLEFIEVVEKSAYDELEKIIKDRTGDVLHYKAQADDLQKANDVLRATILAQQTKYDELISYLPKVPTEPYIKTLQAQNKKLADHLELAIAGLHGANVDIKFLVNRLKEYRGDK